MKCSVIKQIRQPNQSITHIVMSRGLSIPEAYEECEKYKTIWSNVKMVSFIMKMETNVARGI